MGFLSSVGNVFNDLSGITGSSNAAFSQSAQLSRMSYGQQKEFAQNAHQWEMDDLKKAGLNPALTAGGSSAGAIAGGGSTGGAGAVGTSAMSPLGIVDAINSSIQTNSAKKVNEATAEATPINALANLLNAITNAGVGKSTITKNIAETGATERGGLEQWLLGSKSPLKSTVKWATDNVKKAEKETKSYKGKEKEIADKFDKLWK